MSIWLDNAILIFCCCVSAWLGAVFGSFLNCAAWRIAHGESFLKGHSHCVSCGHELGIRDLVPVFSWLAMRGRCRYCKAKISVRYPLTELFFAVVTVSCLLRFDLTVLCLRNWIFLCCLFCLSLVDLETFTIPDGCLIVALAAWVIALPFIGMSLGEAGLHVLAGVVFGGGILGLSLILDKILGKDSLGGGDIKLFGVTGLYLGMIGTLFVVLFSAVIGLAFAAFLRLKGSGEEAAGGDAAVSKAADNEGKGGKAADNEGKGGKAADNEGKGGKAAENAADEDDAGLGHIPFGPSISLAAAFMLLFGQGIVAWYLSLLNM